MITWEIMRKVFIYLLWIILWIMVILLGFLGITCTGLLPNLCFPLLIDLVLIVFFTIVYFIIRRNPKPMEKYFLTVLLGAVSTIALLMIIYMNNLMSILPGKDWWSLLGFSFEIGGDELNFQYLCLGIALWLLFVLLIRTKTRVAMAVTAVIFALTVIDIVIESSIVVDFPPD